MFTLTSVLSPLPGREQELTDACIANMAPSRAEPGKLFCDLLVSEDHREVVFYEAYVDEAASSAHMAAPHTKHWQETALLAMERSSIRFPAHRSIASAP